MTRDEMIGPWPGDMVVWIYGQRPLEPVGIILARSQVRCSVMWSEEPRRGPLI